jgi:protease I
MSIPATLPLAGKRIAVVVESKFIPEEIAAYRNGFGVLGAQVEFVSRLNYGDYQPQTATFLSDVDPLDQPEWSTAERLVATVDVSALKLDDYSALLMAANYPAVRLRYAGLPEPSKIGPNFNVLAHIQSPPAVQLFARAMLDKTLVKGFLCHGLWILTPNPQLLKGRTVVCNEVVAADIYWHGANIDFSRRVIVDDDVVTGYSKHEVVAYVQAVAAAILK